MAQVFWEQIRNELPDIGEFLSGSLSISGSFSTSGSVSLELDGIEDTFKVSVEGEEKIKINTEGVLQFTSQSIEPTAIEGGIYYNSSDDFYLGFNN